MSPQFGRSNRKQRTYNNQQIEGSGWKGRMSPDQDGGREERGKNKPLANKGRDILYYYGGDVIARWGGAQHQHILPIFIA
mmetsp:Transcript_27570/g.57285  ORF Transcript_27570/g.57285 Transcript_27570/m.57285 type:complete len:80 (+) Transcript_27570:265-504(+)